jgi:hypothetical protein
MACAGRLRKKARRMRLSFGQRTAPCALANGPRPEPPWV